MTNVFNMLDHILRSIDDTAKQTHKTKTEVDPNRFYSGARTFLTLLKGNHWNSCDGSQLTSPIYMKCFSQVSLTWKWKYLRRLFIVGPNLAVMQQYKTKAALSNIF